MDVSELRKKILRALDDARKEATVRRREVDQAAAAFETFLTSVAVPVVRQAAQVLNASGETFAVNTPTGSVRLVSEKSPQTFIEFVLDVAGSRPEVLGRVSLTRGRSGHVVAERPLVPDRSIASLTDDDVSAFLVAEIPNLIVHR